MTLVEATNYLIPWLGLLTFVDLVLQGFLLVSFVDIFVYTSYGTNLFNKHGTCLLYFGHNRLFYLLCVRLRGVRHFQDHSVLALVQEAIYQVTAVQGFEFEVVVDDVDIFETHWRIVAGFGRGLVCFWCNLIHRV